MRNLLIDQKLERAALLPSEDEALRMMRGPLGQRKVVTAAWSRDGSKAHNRRAATWHPLRVWAGPEWGPLCRLA